MRWEQLLLNLLLTERGVRLELMVSFRPLAKTKSLPPPSTIETEGVETTLLRRAG